MRLLRAAGDCDFSLVEYTENIPPYAILSHTWGADHEEVTFKDIYKGKGKGKTKLGYAKLQFCAAQAAKDGLEYFWVDTCCIDKSSSAELSEAINSMYKWYRDSTVCYVYLSDIPCRIWNTTTQEVPEESFLSSRWFTRGWTFQELLAPRKLLFFSADGAEIGDKTDFLEGIARQTHIPSGVIKNSEITWKYDVENRIRWTMNRKTKREEDAAYSLLGFFGVQMPLIYGEGRNKAFDRLRIEIRRHYLQQYFLGAASLVKVPWERAVLIAKRFFPKWILKSFRSFVDSQGPNLWVFWLVSRTVMACAVIIFFITFLIFLSTLFKLSMILILSSALLSVSLTIYARGLTMWTAAEQVFNIVGIFTLLCSFFILLNLHRAQQELTDSLWRCSCSHETRVW